MTGAMPTAEAVGAGGDELRQIMGKALTSFRQLKNLLRAEQTAAEQRSETKAAVKALRIDRAKTVEALKAHLEALVQAERADILAYNQTMRQRARLHEARSAAEPDYLALQEAVAGRVDSPEAAAARILLDEVRRLFIESGKVKPAKNPIALPREDRAADQADFDELLERYYALHAAICIERESASAYGVRRWVSHRRPSRVEEEEIRRYLLSFTKESADEAENKYLWLQAVLQWSRLRSEILAMRHQLRDLPVIADAQQGGPYVRAVAKQIELIYENHGYVEEFNTDSLPGVNSPAHLSTLEASVCEPLPQLCREVGFCLAEVIVAKRKLAELDNRYPPLYRRPFDFFSDAESDEELLDAWTKHEVFRVEAQERSEQRRAAADVYAVAALMRQARLEKAIQALKDFRQLNMPQLNGESSREFIAQMWMVANLIYDLEHGR